MQSKPHRPSELHWLIARSEVFGLDDMIPLPCNPDQICIGYGLRSGTQVTLSPRCCRAT